MKKPLFLFLLILTIIVVIMTFQKNKRILPPFYNMSDAVNAVKMLPDYRAFTHHKEGILPIHLTSTGGKDAPNILFIHGSPGSWEGWSEYLHDDVLRDKYFMVAVDGPGYGGSDDGISGATLNDQANAIASAIQNSFPSKKKWLVVGHSYGGPVALRLAVDYPEIVSSILLLAPAISPDLVRVRWYNKIASMPLVRNLISIPLKRSNDEMYLLPSELADLKPDLHMIKKDIKIIQGENDGIVQPKNIDYAREVLVNSAIDITIIENRGHFLPWEEYDRIKNYLMEAL